jgi:hypothetical protein
MFTFAKFEILHRLGEPDGSIFTYRDMEASIIHGRSFEHFLVSKQSSRQETPFEIA